MRINYQPSMEDQFVVRGWLWFGYFFIGVVVLCLLGILVPGFLGEKFGAFTVAVGGILFAIPTPVIWFAAMVFFSVLAYSCATVSVKESVRRRVPL